MTKEEQKAVEEFTEMNLTKKGLYHYNDMQDAFLIGLFKGEKMQSSLPSELDEAVLQFAQRAYSPFDDPYEVSKAFENDVNCFKAGAEWMAGQGRTVDGTFHRSRGYPSVIELKTYLRDYEGADVIVQIRKKQ